MDNRPHGDLDKIIERSRAGYCLTHSEEVHLCDHAERLRAALLWMVDAHGPEPTVLTSLAYDAAVDALDRCHPKLIEAPK